MLCPFGAEQQAFEYEQCYDGCEYAQQHVDDVVVCGVNRCPPDAHTDECEYADAEFVLTTYYGVDCSYEHICGVQRGHGSEHVRVVAVDGVEHRRTDKRVETSESGYAARRVKHGCEAMLQYR